MPPYLFASVTEVTLRVLTKQSSGRSSTPHSLSGIPFPSGSGLATRCPTQLILSITMRSDEPRSIVMDT